MSKAYDPDFDDFLTPNHIERLNRITSGKDNVIPFPVRGPGRTLDPHKLADRLQFAVQSEVRTMSAKAALMVICLNTDSASMICGWSARKLMQQAAIRSKETWKSACDELERLDLIAVHRPGRRRVNKYMPIMVNRHAVRTL